MVLHKKPVKTKKELLEEKRLQALDHAKARKASGKVPRKKSRKRRKAAWDAATAPLPERKNNMIVVTLNEMHITHAYGNINRQPFETEVGAQKAAARLEAEHPETKFHIIPLRKAPYLTEKVDRYT